MLARGLLILAMFAGVTLRAQPAANRDSQREGTGERSRLKRRTQATALTNVNALWVDSASLASNPVTDPDAQQTLIQNSAASGVNMLYLSVYSSTANSAGLLMYENSDIAALIGSAHTQGIQVYAQYGDPDWPTTGCAASASPMSRLADINSYNTLNPSAMFDGVMLDVEPSAPIDFQALVELYQCLQQQAQMDGFGLGAAISAFWNTPVSGSSELPYQQIVDLDLNMIVVMGYRNFAGNTICPPAAGNQGDGVVCLDEAVISYANTSQSNTSILVGLETNVESSSDQDETFYSLGQSAMNAVEQSVSSQFAAATPPLIFSGFAIDNYQSSYLSGQIPGWPATNPPMTNPAPAIGAGGVVSASAFGEFSSIAPGSWIEIYGSNLAADTRGWATTDFNGVNAPTSLDGTSVTIAGQSAFVSYISPGQVNVQVPSGITPGSQQVIVTTGVGASSPYLVTVNATEPGLLAPASFIVGGNQYVAALFPDYVTFAIPAGAITNVPSRPAQPGDTLIIYGVGFGDVLPSIPAGQLVQAQNMLAAPFDLYFGSVQATLAYAGLAPGYVGLYQFNVVVPAVPAGDLVPLTFTLNGSPGEQTLFIAVQTGS
jgi:uncharacterized protein (TIGR03437 family)